MKIKAALKHLVRRAFKYKGTPGGGHNKIRSIIPTLTIPEIRNISQNEKPSEE